MPACLPACLSDTRDRRAAAWPLLGRRGPLPLLVAIVQAAAREDAYNQAAVAEVAAFRSVSQSGRRRVHGRHHTCAMVLQHTSAMACARMVVCHGRVSCCCRHCGVACAVRLRAQHPCGVVRCGVSVMGSYAASIVMADDSAHHHTTTHCRVRPPVHLLHAPVLAAAPAGCAPRRPRSSGPSCRCVRAKRAPTSRNCPCHSMQMAFTVARMCLHVKPLLAGTLCVRAQDDGGGGAAGCA